MMTKETQERITEYMKNHKPPEVSFDVLVQQQFGHMQHEHDRHSALFIQKRKEVASFLAIIHDQQTEVTTDDSRKVFQETLLRQAESLEKILKSLDSNIFTCACAYRLDRLAFLKRLEVIRSPIVLLESIISDADACSYPIYSYT